MTERQVYLEEIKRIKIGKDVYDITILAMVWGDEVKKITKYLADYYCAYCYLEGADKFKDEDLNYPTFHKGNTVGVDTTHFWNTEQTLEEKKVDAIEQITRCIKAYRRLKNGRNRKKN